MRAWGVLAAALAIAAWAAVAMVGRLTEARARLARAEEAAATPALAVPHDAAIVAPDRVAAGRRLAAALADEGSISGVRLATAPGEGSTPPDFVGLRIVARGPEAALRGFARAAEAGPPVIRFARWRINADAAGLRLEAEAIAPWRRP